jgi:pimeloyl-ACP methyl ester carboxylesterase
VVIFGGFDSYVEEFFPLMLAFAHAGYQVVGFEGPGQGGALKDAGLVLTPHWHRPVGAVLDHLGLDGVALLGISLGGGLAIRAAAREPRVTRVIADDILTDFLAANLRQVPGAARTAVRALRAAHAALLLDRLVKRRARGDLLTSWGINQGEHVLGVRTPHEYFAALARYRTAEVSALVRADVLLLAGAEDHYVPIRQLSDQLNTLTSARSVTARVFTRHEQAHNHVQVGNIGLSLQVMLDWLDGLDERDATWLARDHRSPRIIRSASAQRSGPVSLRSQQQALPQPNDRLAERPKCWPPADPRATGSRPTFA